MRVLIKGAGDLASGIACRLTNCGFQVMMTDLEVPTAVRRTVSFSRAVYEGAVSIEDVEGVLIHTKEELEEALADGKVAVSVDPDVVHMDWYEPEIVIDAILAKINTGTQMDDAPLVIGVGPGFSAGKDCDYVVETKRGHYLGQVIEKGSAIPNTGIPGEVGGYTIERVIRTDRAGLFQPIAQIGEQVKSGQIVALCDGEPIQAEIGGIVRGMLQEGLKVKAGMKCGDIDPRCRLAHCFTVSEKARAIAGGVLEAILRRYPVTLRK